MSYRRVTPVIFLARIFEGKSVANVTGERENSQAFAPAFSPDGQRIAYASTRSGNMDIWVVGAPHYLNALKNRRVIDSASNIPPLHRPIWNGVGAPEGHPWLKHCE